MKKPRRNAGMLAAALPRRETPAESAIRALRSASNAAIASGDVAAIADTLAEDFVVLIGDGTLLSRAAYLEAFAHTFEQPVPLRYERIVDTIHISTTLSRAAEHGHWIGRVSAAQADGEILFSGTYMAMWLKLGAGWKLRSELFVSLT